MRCAIVLDCRVLAMSSSSLPEARRGYSLIAWLNWAMLIVIFDQLSKAWFSAQLQLHDSQPVFFGLNFVLVHNPGAAFSFLSDAGGWQRWFLPGLSAVCTIAFTIWLSRISRTNVLLSCALMFIIAGAFGNFIDRVLFGYVVDFIDVYYLDWHWPAFNVADSAICVGAALFFWDALRGGRRGDSAESP